MVTRTGKPSEKMLLQELMNKLLSQKNINLQDLIRQGEQVGIHFLFNQASTGRVTGITYFHNGFKIKGQALGNRFKWAEIIKRWTMNKLETARQLAKQTAEQQQNTENKQQQVQVHTPPPMNYADQELAWFLNTLEEIYRNSEDLKEKMESMQKNHWKQIRMLIFLIIAPLILSLMALVIYMGSK